MRYRGVIFDLDGTLLESSAGNLDWLHDAVRDALRLTGVNHASFSEEQLEALAGIQGYHRFCSACVEAGVEPTEFWVHVTRFRARNKLKFIESGGLKLFDGVEESLEGLRAEGVKMGLVSNSPDLSVDMICRYFGVDRYMHYIRGVTDVEDLRHRKPDPIHLEMAASELHRGPFLYVGDAESDESAARNAGMKPFRLKNQSDIFDLIDEVK